MTADRSMRIVPGSGDSLMCPPGHPMLTHHLEAGKPTNPSLIAGLDYALRNEYGDVPTAIRQRVEALYAKAQLVRSEWWEREVYGYFRNCYSPDGVDRNVQHLLIVGMSEPYYREHPKVLSGEVTLSEYSSLNEGPVVTWDDPRVVPEHNAGFLCVRKYFPDAKPRLDLIKALQLGLQLSGTRPCIKCGEGVQYEAHLDAFAVVTPDFPKWKYSRACSAGGQHEVELIRLPAA